MLLYWEDLGIGLVISNCNLSKCIMKMIISCIHRMNMCVVCSGDKGMIFGHNFNSNVNQYSIVL